MDTWKQKLGIGEAGEVLTEYYLTDVLEKTVVRSFGFDRSKDFLVNGIPVELKTDIYSAKSGNVCIEHISLNSHTAKYVVYMLPNFYVAKRTDLQHLITYWPDVRPGGDDSRKQTILRINTPTFGEIFKKI